MRWKTEIPLSHTKRKWVTDNSDIVMSRRYIFRADGNAHIGLGHIMRSLTIADALSTIVGREAIIFACADEGSAKIAAERGYQTRVFGTDYDRMEEELPLWDSLCQDETVILVDSYHVTDAYLEALGKHGKVAIMDDLQDHRFPVDAVINYNIFADRDKYLELYGELNNCHLGSDYIPVRPEFNNVPYEIKDRIENVLITMGGADYLNITAVVYDALHATLMDKSDGGKSDSIRFHVISGLFSPGYQELKKREEAADDIIVYHDVKDMAGLISKCDLAITAGGSTIYELAAVGVPFICLSYAKNQEAAVEYIGREIAINAGAYDKNPELTIKNVKSAFADKYTNADYRRQHSEIEKRIVDGKGSMRIAEVLINL